jgi:exosortase
MSQVEAISDLKPTQERFVAPDRILPWLRQATLAILIGLLFYQVWLKLVKDWWGDPNFSHGFFVPLFSALLVWQKRHKLAQIPIRPAFFGLLLIIGALMTLVVGVLGAELFLSRVSFVLLLAGLTIYFLGWQYFRAVLFPWAFLFLMIPIPAIVFNQVTFPLQLLASQFASSLLSVLGVPVLREGNVIQLPAMSLEVAEACSGIRSLMSLGTLAIIYGYFLDSNVLRRVILALVSIPIAVFANALRIVGTGVTVQYWDPEKALGFFHEFSGWVIFMLSLGMLFVLHRLIKLIYKPKLQTT